MPNGKYRITVTSKTKPSSNFQLVIYNPFYGCYGHDIDKDYVELDWIIQDNGTCTAELELNTEYEHNYAMLGDVSAINADKMNSYNVKIVRYNNVNTVNQSSEQIVGW